MQWVHAIWCAPFLHTYISKSLVYIYSFRHTVWNYDWFSKWKFFFIFARVFIFIFHFQHSAMFYFSSRIIFESKIFQNQKAIVVRVRRGALKFIKKIHRSMTLFCLCLLQLCNGEMRYSIRCRRSFNINSNERAQYTEWKLTIGQIIVSALKICACEMRWLKFIRFPSVSVVCRICFLLNAWIFKCSSSFSVRTMGQDLRFLLL